MVLGSSTTCAKKLTKDGKEVNCVVSTYRGEGRSVERRFRISSVWASALGLLFLSLFVALLLVVGSLMWLRESGFEMTYFTH